MVSIILALIVVLLIFVALAKFLYKMARMGAGNGMLSGVFFAAAFIWHQHFSIGVCRFYDPYAFIKLTNCDAGWIFLIPAMILGAIAGGIGGIIIKHIVSDFRAWKSANKSSH